MSDTEIIEWNALLDRLPELLPAKRGTWQYEVVEQFDLIASKLAAGKISQWDLVRYLPALQAAFHT